eukprot:CAMPEP_0198232122 /NCGR_PEP_ID=MMETSP1445-20131203/115560_1 /TAXON_ID=36898 /ORGANISM="Pyramimonas sp., Strain CCMP2087" /LENGTH=884 /DNA_ID=CAMNT_0043912773 /DNA_START=630 /DNA_END=3284 /DNA_ORIENTATION=-
MRNSWWLGLLVGIFLLTGQVVSEELDQAQLEDNEQAQAEGREEEEPVVSHIVEAADEVELQSGDGDLDTTGRCASDITHFCAEVKPGEGRLAKCLTTQNDLEEKGNVDGRKMTGECKEEVRNFKIERATNVNFDVVLATSCKADAAKFCDDATLYPEPGAVVTCLREVEEKLNEGCKTEIFRTKLESSKDFGLDAMLHELCEDDAKVLCEGVQPGEGRTQECLRKKRVSLSWDCQEELFRKEVEDAGDLRLNTVLLRVCSADKKKFCAEVKPGMGNAKQCLEDNRDKPDFSADCKSKFEEMMARRATDFRLDAKLREQCRDDIESICGYEKDSLDSTAGYDGRVIECLQDYREELTVGGCKKQVHKLTTRAASDIRFDRPLADACYDDRKRLCENVSPGSARVLRCLQDSRDQLSYECRATLFDQEVRLAEDIDFKFPMKKACTKEIQTFCKDVPHGHARIITCLQEHDEDDQMSPECKAEVKRDEIREAEDYRLNYRLNKACDAEIDELCPDVCSPFQGQACGGTVITCLKEKQDNITSEDCKSELFKTEMKESKDWRNDAQVKEACADDVNQFCADISPGGGKVHDCLSSHKEELSPKCKELEEKFNQIQASDVRLRPGFKACSEEMAVYCKTIKPGKGRMFRCLQNNLGKVDFSSQCKEQVEKKQARMAGNWKMDFGVAKNCKVDTKALCGEKLGVGHGKGAVLKCLVEHHNQISDGNCANEVSRAVRMALWQYRKGSAMTAACDEDAASCQPPSGKTLKSVGVVGRCLSKKVAEDQKLVPGCKAIVSIAAPKDAKQLFDGTLAGLSVLEKITSLEKSIGMKGTMVAKDRAGNSMVTLTGWVALASIGSLIIVIVVGIYWMYRKYTGQDRPYTLVVKGGDV